MKREKLDKLRIQLVVSKNRIDFTTANTTIRAIIALIWRLNLANL